MAAVRTFTLPHYEAYPVQVALFKSVTNAEFLRSQLLAANPEFDYAFLDAAMVSGLLISQATRARLPARPFSLAFIIHQTLHITCPSTSSWLPVLIITFTNLILLAVVAWPDSTLSASRLTPLCGMIYAGPRASRLCQSQSPGLSAASWPSSFTAPRSPHLPSRGIAPNAYIVHFLCTPRATVVTLAHQ